MTKMEISTGDRYGRLTIVKELGGYPRKFECLCDCGTTTNKYLSNLRNGGARGQTRSCGCIRTESIVKRSTTHGMHHVPAYEVWCGMHKRCSNPKSKSYPDYGGRGISVSEEWKNFDTFYKDMGPRPSSAHSIERNNTNGNYEKSNCRWATKTEQNRNTRVTATVTINGESKCVSEWDEIFSARKNVKRGRFKDAYYRRGIQAAISLMNKEG